MSTTLKTHEPVCPTDRETTLARQASRELTSISNHDLKIRIPKTNEEITIPASAVRLLTELLSELAEGNAVALTPIGAELTTTQAADLLGVSRPFLIKQLEAGLIPFRKVGAHRRILFKDIMTHRRQTEQKRLDTLEKLAAQAQNLDMGY